MQAWIFLGLAIACEVIATTALKAADGFSRPGPTVLVIGGYAASFYLLSLTLRHIPLGVAYAVWSGAGIALIALLGWLFYKQTLDGGAIAGLSLIVAGVIVLSIFSDSRLH